MVILFVPAFSPILEMEQFVLVRNTTIILTNQLAIRGAWQGVLMLIYQLCVCENFHWIKFCQAQVPLYCRKISRKSFVVMVAIFSIIIIIFNAGKKRFV